MNKNSLELELEKLKAGVERFHATMDALVKVCSVVGWVAGLYLIMRGLESIVLAHPESIEALALVVDKLQVNSILGWLSALVAGGAWFHERKGKKRAYKKLSELRKQLESGDPHKGTSGLDENGHTP